MKPTKTAVMALLLPLALSAKVDLVTLPGRDSVQVTIYNSADLTLVREERALTLRKGVNKLQFSWANTLIDPTSLEMRPTANAADIEVFDLVYPPRTTNLGLWNIDSRRVGPAPFEITYFTSGISWRAFYMGTLEPDEKTMRLQGYVRVANGSGEDYEEAQTRLIVGKVHILDQIADLARRRHPYGSPVAMPKSFSDSSFLLDADREVAAREMDRSGAVSYRDGRKQIVKEGLSEYFLYTIEGTETIPNGWSKRLPSFEAGEVPVVNLFKYEEERYGPSVVRFLSFKNDEKHDLGETPIPGGLLRVYRRVDDRRHLSYEGQSSFKYIPVEEDVELNLGATGKVLVEPVQMAVATDRYKFDGHGNVAGWDQILDYQVTVKNTRPVAAKVEVKRNFRHQYWDLLPKGDFDDYEKEDLDTATFTLLLPPRSEKRFTYQLTYHEGTNRE
jgi:hypothetical protein